MNMRRVLAMKRRPFLAGMTVAVVAAGSVSLPAPSAAASPLEQAVAEVRAARLAQLRHYYAGGVGAEAPAGQFMFPVLQAVGRMRDAATAEGFTYAQYRAILKLAMRRAAQDYRRGVAQGA